jgi:hypothetical protein
VIPAGDVCHLVSGLVDDGGRPQDVVPRNLDRRYRAGVSRVPQAKARFEDRCSETFVDVSQDRRRRLSELIEDLRHGAIRE